MFTSVYVALAVCIRMPLIPLLAQSSTIVCDLAMCMLILLYEATALQQCAVSFNFSSSVHVVDLKLLMNRAY